MTAEPEDLDALRDALYRPGATDADRARYAAAVARSGAPGGTARPGAPGEAARSGEAARAGAPGEALRSGAPDGAERSDEPDGAPREPSAASGRHVRPGRTIVAGVAAAAVLAGAAVAAVVLMRPAPRPPYPTVASTPIALIGDPGEQAVSRADLRTLFDDAKPFLGLYLARHATSLSSSLRTDSIAVDGRGTGPTTVALAGITTPGQPTGLMTVLLTCDRSAAYTWVLSGPARTRTGASGDDCGGRIVTATFVPRPNRVPTSIRITVPKGVRVVVEVDLSKY